MRARESIRNEHIENSLETGGVEVVRKDGGNPPRRST
jgi:hypothetical protein